MQTSVLVPVVVQKRVKKRVRVPQAILSLVKSNFFVSGVRMPFSSDFDDTLVSSPTDKSKRLALNGTEVESPLVSLLEKRLPFVIVSGSRKSDIQARFTDPLREVLANRGSLALMQQVVVYTNVGAIRCTFDAEGRLDEAGCEAYKSQFKIPEEEGGVLSEVL